MACRPRKSVVPSCVAKQPSRLPALQRKQGAWRLLRSSEPPWFLGTMWSTSRALWCGVCQATARAAAFAEGLGRGEHPDFDRAADRGAVAAAVPEAAGFCVSKQPTSSPGVNYIGAPAYLVVAGQPGGRCAPPDW